MNADLASLRHQAMKAGAADAVTFEHDEAPNQTKATTTTTEKPATATATKPAGATDTTDEPDYFGVRQTSSESTAEEEEEGGATTPRQDGQNGSSAQTDFAAASAPGNDAMAQQAADGGAQPRRQTRPELRTGDTAVSGDVPLFMSARRPRESRAGLEDAVPPRELLMRQCR